MESAGVGELCSITSAHLKFMIFNESVSILRRLEYLDLSAI